MKSSKVLGALVTLGLAAAAVATPATALEHQFSGAFTSFYDLSNYTAVGNDGSANNNMGLLKSAPTENYFVQRVRLGYTAKASEDVKLVTKFELDYNYIGNSSYANTRGSGGALGADSINIETKNLYLDLNLTKALNTKIGMQGYNDSFKGVIFDADMAGILLSQEYANATVTAGIFRFNDSATTTFGKQTRDMLSLDGKFNITKTTKVGAAYYYIADTRTNGSTITPVGAPTGYTTNGDPIYLNVTTTANPSNAVKLHTLGLNAEAAAGPVTLTGFALAQFGDLSKTTDAKGYAFNLGAKIPAGAGTVRAELLYVPGGKNALSVVSGEGGAFYDNEMIILSRDKNATTIDNAIVSDVNNFGQGVIFGSVGFDYPLSSKLSGSVNVGYAQVAKDLAKHDSKHLGTEVNCEANYKFTPAVTFGARAGYVVLGDYFKTAAGTPDDPYDVKLIAKYSF
jgi:hypothetical protein